MTVKKFLGALQTEKTYILLKDRPSIGKEAGDYYNNEFKESIEELLAKGVIEEEVEEETDKPCSMMEFEGRPNDSGLGIEKL